MKKSVISVLFILIVALSTVVGCGTSNNSQSTSTNQESRSQQPIELKLSYPVPATSFTGKIYDYFAKAVEEETNGEVKIKNFPSGTLVSNSQVYDAITKGTVDLAQFVVPYISPTMSELTSLEVPGAYPGDKFNDFVKVTEPFLDKIFAKYGIHYMGVHDNGTITFAASKKVGKPIQTPEDLKGYLVRTPGKWGGEAIKMWGGSTVQIALSELTNSLQLGAVDVAYTGWIITGPYKLYEVAPYITLTNLQESLCGLIMSDDAWKKLNAEQQAGLKRAAVRMEQYSHELSIQEEKLFIKQVEKSGGTVVKLTPEQNAAFTKVTEPLMEQVKGIVGPEGEELLNALKELR